jgi:hypothetical protein
VDLFGELKTLIDSLESRGIDYALCGGMALAIHGAPRATQDIDILLRPEDIGRLREAARNCGFTLESFPMDFASGLTIQRFTKVIEGQPLMLDVLFVKGPLESVWAGRQTAALEDGFVRVVSREGLISLKLAAGRPQDVADVKRLEELSRG